MLFYLFVFIDVPLIRPLVLGKILLAVTINSSGFNKSDEL